MDASNPRRPTRRRPARRRPALLRPRPAARGGFTLIEILIVVIILGIASAVIVPNLGTRADLYAAAAARTVVADLTYAQSRAITTQQLTYVQFSPSAGTYSLLTAAPTGTPQYVTNPTTGRTYSVAFGAGGSPGLSNAALVSANFDGKTVLAFDQLGTPLSWDATLNAGAGGTAAMASGAVVVRSGSGANAFALTVSIDAYTGQLSVR